MSIIRYILFDCMETLIDLTELPTMREYAYWAYNGSGVEYLWNGFEDFLKCFAFAKKTMEERLPKYKEYELFERFGIIAALNIGPGNPDTADTVSRKLYDNYWRNYVSRCFIKDDVLEVIPKLYEKYSLGVVSNFMIDGGIEELLEKNNLFNYFKFVVTSVREGWRKPCPVIYNTAVGKTCCMPQNILFAGDDYGNDYTGPKTIGLNTVLLDRDNRYPEVTEKISDFYEIERYIDKKFK